jgi:hypothetical protein
VSPRAKPASVSRVRRFRRGRTGRWSMGGWPPHGRLTVRPYSEMGPTDNGDDGPAALEFARLPTGLVGVVRWSASGSADPLPVRRTEPAQGPVTLDPSARAFTQMPDR